MITADPMRTPTLTLFAHPDYFLFAGAPNRSALASASPPQSAPLFAWNHGDASADIAQTWVGFVGPGVGNQGIDKKLWSDHTDVRPTMLTVLGLQDDYVHDGRVHWVKVLVDANSREVFAYQPQIVPGNRTAVPAP